MPPAPSCLDRITRALEARERRSIPADGLLPAAVTVPLVPVENGHAILFTVRTTHVEQHKGEISFPGGRLDPGDADSLAAALRETWEEVGIRPEELRVLGPLDDFVSVTGYRVTPYVVYLAEQNYRFALEPREVAEVLLVPLHHLLERSGYHAEKAADRRYHIHHFTWGPYVIWGLTAAILKRFLDLSFGFSGP